MKSLVVESTEKLERARTRGLPIAHWSMAGLCSYLFLLICQWRQNGVGCWCGFRTSHRNSALGRSA